MPMNNYNPSSVAITGGVIGGVPVARVAADGNQANTVVMAGDSLAATNWSITPGSLNIVQSCGAFMWANALGGNRFTVLDNVAVGGKTAAQVLTEQIPAVIARKPKYCHVTIGTNDLYLDLVAGNVAASRVIACLEALMGAGITPVWSTVWARSPTAGVIADHVWCNDLLRQYAANNNVGVFFDGFRVSQLPGAAFDGRANWWRDSAPSVHPNNLGAYYLGKAMFKAYDAIVPKFNPFASGAEDRTNSAKNGSNLLLNPYFAGTAGTVNANCTGTMPDSWSIDWATRTGTGSAAVSIVDVLDPDTGLVNAKGIQVVLSGAIANGDIIRVRQLGMQSLLNPGDLFAGEGVLSLVNPTQFLQVAMHAGVDVTGTWWGLNSGTNQSLPESATLGMQTLKIAVPAGSAPASALFDVQITFNGAATGSFILSQPRVRRG